MPRAQKWICVLLALPLLLALIVSASADDEASPGQLYQDRELNYSFLVPRDWTPLDARAINEDASLVLRSTRQEQLFMVIAEQVGTDAGLTTEGVTQFARQHLEEQAQSFRVLTAAKSEIDGEACEALLSRAKVRGLDLYFAHRILCLNGYSYQLSSWAPVRSTSLQAFADRSGELFGRFRILDREQRGTATRGAALSRYQEPRFGIEIDYGTSGWNRWQNIEEQLPEAVHAAEYQGTGLLVLVALSFPERAPDLELLSHALLAVMDFTPSSRRFAARRTIRGDNLSGYEYSLLRSSENNNFRYRLRVLRGTHHAYLIAAWLDPEAKVDDTVFGLIDRIEIDGSVPPSVDTLSAEEKTSQASVFLRLGDQEFKRERYHHAATWFQHAYELDREQELALNKLLSAWTWGKRDREGLAYLEQNWGRHPDSLTLRGWRAHLRRRTGDAKGALSDYQQLFAGDFFEEEDLFLYAELLTEMGRIENAIELVTRYRNEYPSLAMTRQVARLEQRRGRPEAAVALLEKELEQGFFETSLAMLLLDAYFETEQHAPALKLCDEMLARHEAGAPLYFEKGRHEYALGRFRQARDSFAQALELNPADGPSREYLEHISNLIGTGNRAGTEEPITPVAITETIAARFAATPEELPASPQGAVVLARLRAIHFERGSDLRRTDRYRIRITSARGVEEFSTFRFSFDPLGESVYLNELLVTDASGQITVGDRESSYVLDENGGEASQEQVYTVPVPGIAVGSTIDLTITRRHYGSGLFPFQQQVLVSSQPQLWNGLLLSGDVDGVQFRNHNGLQPARQNEAGEERILWQTEGGTPYRWQPDLPHFTRYLPTVVLNDATTSWAEESTDYFESIREQLAVTDIVRSTAERVVAGIVEDADKIAALAHWVQKNCTYHAIEFGQRARIPNSPESTLRNRYGDCKDHATLLYALLRAVDLPAKLALVHLGGVIDLELPSLSQFNHMIVHTELDGRDWFIDSTDKYFDFRVPVPLALAGQSALLVGAKEHRFVEIGDYDVDACRVGTERQITFDADGDIAVTEEVKLHGYYAAFMRQHLQQSDRARWRQQLQSELTQYGCRLEIDEFQVERLEELTAPLVLTLRYRLDDRVHSLLERTVASPFALLERYYLSGNGDNDERHTPFQVTYPLRFRSQTSVRTGSTLKLADAALPGRRERRGSVLNWRTSSSTGQGAIHITLEAERLAGHYAATDYAPYQRALQAIFPQLEPRLVLTGRTLEGSPQADHK